MLKVGDRAPDFSAPIAGGGEFVLSSFLGKKCVVLSFYPRDFTPGCTEQACSYRDAYAEIDALGAVIAGISADSEERHERFADTHGLPYPLISDPDQRLSEEYGVRRLFGLVPLLKRVTYVIDRRGVIRNVIHHEFRIGQHIGEIQASLRELEQESANGSASR